MEYKENPRPSPCSNLISSLAEHISSLSSLNLRGCGVTGEDIQILGKEFGSTLKSLDIMKSVIISFFLLNFRTQAQKLFQWLFHFLLL